MRADDFLVNDPVQAYVDSAKMLALLVIDLLWQDAETGKAVIAASPVPMSREVYLQKMRSFSSVRKFDASSKPE